MKKSLPKSSLLEFLTGLVCVNVLLPCNCSGYKYYMHSSSAEGTWCYIDGRVFVIMNI